MSEPDSLGPCCIYEGTAGMRNVIVLDWGGCDSRHGNDFHTRIEGTRIRHHMGPASLKLYDKFGLMARVECTANEVSFFKHHRFVEQRNG
ncbi:MAG: hypothetical protein ACHBNF_04585, partial [Chromatiales bacterium]